MKRYYIILTSVLLLTVLMTSTVLGNQIQPDDVEKSGGLRPFSAETRLNSIKPALSSATSIEPNSLTFGDQAINNTSAVKTITLQNTGSTSLTITSTSISSHYSQTNNCPVAPSTLALNATCEFNITFAPSSSGSKNGILTVNSDAINSPNTVNLTGKGVYKTFLPTVIKGPYEPQKGVLLPSAYSFCGDLGTLSVGWYYRNSIMPSPDCPTNDRRFVPRLANAKAVTSDLIAAAIDSAQASGWIIGFVEPNIKYWGGYITPQEGAIIWRQIENQALPAGIKLVAPSPSQHDPGGLEGEATVGYTWIWEMIAAYENEYGEKPHFDALGWNYYDRNPNNVKNFLIARRQEALTRGYDIPFWILEYAGECWNTGNYPTGNDSVMTQITPFFNNTSWISRYAWFTNRIKATDSWAPNWHSCSLLDSDTGTLTQLGILYKGY